MMIQKDFVVKAFQTCADKCDPASCPYRGFIHDDCKSILMDDIYEMLYGDKRNPKEYPPTRYNVNITYGCGNCKAEVTKGMNFCPSCGQPINWELS